MARANLKLHADRELLKKKLEKQRLRIRVAEDRQRIQLINAELNNHKKKAPGSA